MDKTPREPNSKDDGKTDVLTEIFRAASKHPNSRVSKLIHQVEEEPSQKNIVLLLIELAEHAEYSTDFNISLKYYLDLFERCGINHDLVLNEAGLLLVNSSKIYSKRVDYVQSLVERQILTLSNSDDELQKQRLEQEQTENATTADKPKRGRKRALEAPSDPYEVELAPKKFKKLTEEKRFALPKVATKAKTISRNIEMEQHIHPAGWQHATIYDLENEEDVDTKRNYKLFTFHVEHRYNTLVPDINFRLHFKVKDYMDEQEEMEEDEACNTDQSWPPLSEAYVQKYLRLENYILGQEMRANKRKLTNETELEGTDAKVINLQPANESQQHLNACSAADSIYCNNSTELLSNTLHGSVGNISTNACNATDSINCNHSTELLSNTLDGSDGNISRNLIMDTANNKEESSKSEQNDSGLSQSILDEIDSTLENSQLSSSLEISQTQKSLSESNTSAMQIENDSALGSSVLEQSTTQNDETLNTTSKNDSALETNAEGETTENTVHFATTEENARDPDVEESGKKSSDSAQTQTDNDTSLHTELIIQPTQQDSTCTTIDVHNDALNTISKEGKDLKQFNVEELEDGRVNVISTENSTMPTEILNKSNSKNGESSSIDIVEEQDKNSTQILVNLPSPDDEGVCLSDLDDIDYRLLSPIIKTTNILPGVGRKDITIIMDEELRQALEMRDGIMKHFGCETFTVPVIAEPKKTNLIFNILKLPEKLVRRKILFKLGPDMDLYIQSRCLKRSRADAVARTGRNFQLLKWFPLNNTDMTGVCMTPPPSPGHVSDFCGFSDNEDDTISSVDFCGFTEEEQLTFNTKPISRLSRDSGVGVDVNNLTVDKETIEIIFEEETNLAIKNCKININSNELETETSEEILKQLPDDIRTVLSLELEETSENNKEAAAGVNSNTPLTSSNSQEVNNLETQLTDNFSSDKTPHINTEATDITKESEDCSFTQTQETYNVIPTEKSNDTHTCTEQNLINSETFAATESQQKPSQNNTETQSFTEAVTSAEIDMPCNEFSILEKEPNDGANDIDDDDDDGIILDLDSQGTKTKIQQWHEHLQPILAKSRERHHFDIYKLGTEIIDTIQNKRTSPLHSSAASFESIMQNKDKSYVSRYFLSTLLLANQSNIGISIQNKTSDSPSAWHDINLKLLSTKRHTVAIEDNIGMIDSKQRTKTQNVKQNNKEVQKTAITKHQLNVKSDDDEDEPLIKQQSTAGKLKTPVKRNSGYANISCIVEKKPKEISFETPTESQHTTLPHLVQQSVHNLQPPFAASHEVNSFQPSTSRQTQYLPLFNVNMNAIRTLQPIEKVLNRSDDHDSGIFSVDEISTS